VHAERRLLRTCDGTTPSWPPAWEFEVSLPKPTRDQIVFPSLLPEWHYMAGHAGLWNCSFPHKRPLAAGHTVRVVERSVPHLDEIPIVSLKCKMERGSRRSCDPLRDQQHSVGTLSAAACRACGVHSIGELRCLFQCHSHDSMHNYAGAAPTGCIWGCSTLPHPSPC
jgi:hypothetical protein